MAEEEKRETRGAPAPLRRGEKVTIIFPYDPRLWPPALRGKGRNHLPADNCPFPHCPRGRKGGLVQRLKIGLASHRRGRKAPTAIALTLPEYVAESGLRTERRNSSPLHPTPQRVKKEGNSGRSHAHTSRGRGADITPPLAPQKGMLFQSPLHAPQKKPGIL